MAGGYLRRGHQSCSFAPSSRLRDQETSANPCPRPPAHVRNHGRSGSSLGRTAHHRLVHLPRAAAGEYIPGLWVGEGTRNAPRDPLVHFAIAAPTQPILSIPVYQSAVLVLFVPARSRAHILAQTLSPVRPRPVGNKDSGVRRSPAADDHDQRGKKHPL